MGLRDFKKRNSLVVQQWFSNYGLHNLEGLLELKLPCPIPRLSDSVGLGWGQGDADDSSPR